MGGYKGLDILISFNLDIRCRFGGYFYFYDPEGYEGCKRLNSKTDGPTKELSDRKVTFIDGGISENTLPLRYRCINSG